MEEEEKKKKKKREKEEEEKKKEKKEDEKEEEEEEEKKKKKKRKKKTVYTDVSCGNASSDRMYCDVKSTVNHCVQTGTRRSSVMADVILNRDIWTPSPQYPLNWTLGGPHSPHGRLVEETVLCLC